MVESIACDFQSGSSETKLLCLGVVANSRWVGVRTARTSNGWNGWAADPRKTRRQTATSWWKYCLLFNLFGLSVRQPASVVVVHHSWCAWIKLWLNRVSHPTQAKPGSPRHLPKAGRKLSLKKIHTVGRLPRPSKINCKRHLNGNNLWGTAEYAACGNQAQ